MSYRKHGPSWATMIREEGIAGRQRAKAQAAKPDHMVQVETSQSYQTHTTATGDFPKED